MRRRLALLTSLALLTGLAPVAAQAVDLPGVGRDSGPRVFAPQGQTTDRFPVATATRVDVPAHDGIALHARVFRPDTSSDPSWKTPVILVHSPYYDGALQGSPDRSLDLVQRFTPKGYTVVLSDLRGTGNSGGCGEQDGANQARDFRTLVEHFAAQPWTNGKVGSYGKSYDAESQKAGAVLQPKGLETMVVVAGISSLYDVAYFDGVPLRANGAASAAAYELYDLDVPGEPSALPRRAERTTCQPANFLNGGDPSGDETTYWAERDFRPGVRKVQASVLEVQGLSDFTVAPIQLDGWFDALPTFKRAVVGQWAHNYPYDTSAALARDDWYDSVHAWFDAELLDRKTGVEGWPAVQVQDEKGVWRAVPSIAGMGAEKALPVGDVLGTTTTSAPRTFAETGTLVRDSAVLTEPLHLSGQAYLDALLTLDRPDGHVALTLSEVTAAGATRTLTRGYLSLPHRETLTRGVPVTPGHTTPYRVRTYPFDKTLAAGSRLRMTLAGYDGSTTPAGTAYTATLGAATLRVPVAQEQCGLLVRTRQQPRAATPDCPDGVPAEAPRYVPDAADGHRATAVTSAPTAEKVGGVDAVRESGYLTVRDGVQLAYEVVRPAGPGPFPTLFTYDGYDAGANPDPGYATRYLPRGYALVGVNLRGTGCSTGVFDFFQPAEAADGYEAVEWMASQPWSTGKVGMVGKSYPGITQLFTAEAQPPHLAAITPGHYFGDAYRDIAFPGGIFNDGFASLWSFVAQPEPGDAAAAQQAPTDMQCLGAQTHKATNLRTNPFLQAQEHPTFDGLLAERSPITHLDRIRVPVYSAFGWQDEQLMSRNTHVVSELDRLGIPYRAVFANGDHGMYRRAPQLLELDRFLEAHVEERAVLRDGTRRSAYLREDPVDVFWEQGATGAPRARTSLPGWGDQATPLRLPLGPGGTMGVVTVDGSDTYVHSLAGTQGIANPKYGGGLPVDQYTWGVAPPEGAALAYTSGAFADDTALLGPASADLWLTATAPNVDLQVTLTELRPDGQEVFVNQGWLRADQRRLDRSSTALLPVQTHAAADVRPLSATEPSLARVEVLPFGHVVRKGSRIRMWVEAPTVVPQLEAFAG
ncbi:MAG: hypothetical protein JWO60_699, partial [Frankiales bacterium]|nr:hypothetical protein [Frankiales bacterium]